MENETGFCRVCWQLDGLKCVLATHGGMLEVQLLDGEKLVALWPCRNWPEAFSLASEWRHNPPRWWPPTEMAA